MDTAALLVLRTVQLLPAVDVGIVTIGLGALRRDPAFAWLAVALATTGAFAGARRR